MIGSITKIFASIFGVFVSILKLPLTLLALPGKLFSKKTEDAAPKPKKNKAFYLEATDAKGFSAEAPQSKAKPAAAKTTANTTPSQPTVAAAPAPAAPVPAPASNYKQFGARRRPGANMKSYLDMAKTIKSA